MIYITRRLQVNSDYVDKWLANKSIIDTLFDRENLYANSLLFEDDDPKQFLGDFMSIDNVKYSAITLNSQGKKYIDGAFLMKTPYRVIFFTVGNRILFYGSKEDLGNVKEFVKEYMSIKEEEISLGDTGFNPIIRICKLSSKKKNESRIDDNNQEMNINEQDEQSDNQTRTVSGFSEFVHNGKQSLNEDDEEKETKKKRRFLIKKKK